jgi:hypothetical protein
MSKSTMNPKINSYKLVKTEVPAKLREPRKWYLENHKILPPPWIAYSSFIPVAVVEDLMREKKDQAIGVKFERNNKPPDRITNMEGALHTFVTPIIDATMHGDYLWEGHHSLFWFGAAGDKQLGRRVLLSALVQKDYETEDVMARVVSLQDHEVVGDKHFPEMLHWTVKQDDTRRRKYNTAIHEYLVYHLTHARRLPSYSSHAARDAAMSVDQAMDLLADVIADKRQTGLPERMRNRFIKHRKGYMLSLEIMFNTAVHQLKNELYLLEELCAAQGYVYTFSPPVIFVQHLGSSGTELLSLIHVAALKHVQTTKKLDACRCVAWNDFATPKILRLIEHALAAQPHILVLSTEDIFPKLKGLKEGVGMGMYGPPKGCEGALLVIHNNSDAFGQNIETEKSGGSLDGVVGTYSSAAGSLMRCRKDLCTNLFAVR